jgi:hypothetical protein
MDIQNYLEDPSMLQTLERAGPVALPASYLVQLPLKMQMCVALISSLFKMDQKVYRRISDNIYQTLQEHKDGIRLAAQIEKNKIRPNAIPPQLSIKYAITS